ncbi:IclR family transcriptional regulator [Kordiimonas sp. SCSIO 12610]|uniref:IclR family transcriptional regulator n=1 Tax=Kordiimonas sp. SCSIO 12610 TaxID=2829597 RepID=UPI00210C7DD9|nr:IclR family transcriptional regulator [Kordiimonas sp. SCSIO 12610]UTW54690.1 IclR family transcriptional regulator [Kordiimonas sp. SCSIO 12610]
MKENKSRTYAAPALEKGLDIIELLASSSDPLSLSEIAAGLDRKVSEIFRMLNVLQNRGFVTIPQGSDRYQLTMKLFQITHNQFQIKKLVALGTPILKRLALDTHQSCHLVIADDVNALVIAQQSSPTNRGFGVRIGATAPLLDTCSGLVLFSHMDDTTKGSSIERHRKAFKTSVKESDLTEISDKIIKRGYHQIASRQIMGVTDIGFPVYDHANKVVASIVLPYLKRIDGQQKCSISEARQFTKTHAAALSYDLGASI